VHARSAPAAWLAAAALIASAGEARGEIYRWVDDDGVVHYTQDLNSVPERHRVKSLALSPVQRAAAAEAMAAVRSVHSETGASTPPAIYTHRVRTATRDAEAALSALPGHPVATALRAALGFEQWTARVVQRTPGPRVVLLEMRASCAPIQRMLSVPGEDRDADDRAFAVRELKACAAGRIAEAARLLDAAGGPPDRRPPAAR
jgi:hypothetical protein